MRQLYPVPTGPHPGTVDVVDAYLPPGPHHATGPIPRSAKARQRPWTTADMVASVDGAASVDGRSAGLGSDGDKAVFRALRSLADIIVVGAGTARTERYGPARVDPPTVAARLARGQQPVPTIAVVTTSGNLDADLPMFDPERVGDGPVPVIVTCAAGEPNTAGLTGHCEVLVAGDHEVDLGEAMVALGARGAHAILSEGGPTLNASMLALGLIDELCLTVSPLVAGGSAQRIVDGFIGPARDVTLVHVLEHDGSLFTRWRFDSDAGR